ncbi:zinc ribbon domain-containing protein [Gordonia sp. (in: high G+C Gram-positive bacteria)]|uniref:zinc ribbon domain-containing protein n=1 Tax=Gordonia sp. (in: high G+C Gram-positive bacteria) TaxID=84139 RepID=UPI003C762C25
MKVPSAQQRQLLDVADLDAELAKMRHELRNLPEDAELTKQAQKLEEIRDDRSRAQVAVDNLQNEFERVDKELTGTAEHLKRDRDQIESGAVGHKALAEFQHEVSGLERRNEALEAELMEVMEQQEATAAELERTEAALLAATEQELAMVADRDAALVAVEEKVTDAQTKRAALIEGIDAAMVAIYEKLREQGRVGAGLLRQRRCGACRMELDPRSLARIAAADEDEVLRCEECTAIMVRTAQSGLPTPAADE